MAILLRVKGSGRVLKLRLEAREAGRGFGGRR